MIQVPDHIECLCWGKVGDECSYLAHSCKCPAVKSPKNVCK